MRVKRLGAAGLIAVLIGSVLVARAVEPTVAFDPLALPGDASAVLMIRPAELLADDQLKPLVPALDQLVKDAGLGISVAGLERVQFVLLGTPDEFTGQAGHYATLRSQAAHDWKPAMRKLFGEARAETIHGQKIYCTDEGLDVNTGDNTHAICYWLPDDRTVVFGTRVALFRRLLKPDANDVPMWRDAWQAYNQQPVAWLLQTNLMPLVGLANIPEDDENEGETASDPLLQDAHFIVGSAELGDKGLVVSASVLCESDEGAQRVAPALERSLKELAGHLVESLELPDDAEAQRLPGELERLGRTFKLSADNSHVRLEGLVTFQLVRAAVATATSKDRLATLQAADEARLTAIAKALNQYHDQHGHYPAPVMLGPDGHTPHSWRVAILPYLEGGKPLAERYRKNEPWDSQHNRQVMRDGLALFHTPAPQEPDDPTACGYYLVIGAGTIFDGSTAATRDSIKDGLDRTILVAEARRNVPWTKPEDLTYAAEQPVPELGGNFPTGFGVALASGKSQWLPADTEEVTLRAMITKDRNDTLVIQAEDPFADP